MRPSRIPTRPRQAGFTVIEIILVLMLLGIVATLGSLGIMSYAESYNISRDASQKLAAGQLAMLRLTKEFIGINSVSSADAASITFTTQHADGPHTYTVSRSGTDLLLTEDGDADILATDVTGFSLEYYEWDYYSTPAALVQTSPAAWVDEVACCTPISITVTSADCKGGELKLKFTDNDNGFSLTYRVTYAGTDHNTCVHNSDHYDVSDPADCDVAKSLPGQEWYDTAYIWNTSAGGKCYAAVPVANDAGSPCATGSGANPPPAGLVGGTKIIKATLTIDGTQPFTISAAPRNIDPCP